MENCKWIYINYWENDCDCDECIEKAADESDNEMQHLEEFNI